MPLSVAYSSVKRYLQLSLGISHVCGDCIYINHALLCMPYGAIGAQSHPILVSVTVCRPSPSSAPKRRPAIDPKCDFTILFQSNSQNTTAVLSSGSPWMEESRVKTATCHSLYHAHITSLFLEWKSADISMLHLLWSASWIFVTMAKWRRTETIRLIGWMLWTGEGWSTLAMPHTKPL